jgi:hypothetical protein
VVVAWWGQRGNDDLWLYQSENRIMLGHRMLQPKTGNVLMCHEGYPEIKECLNQRRVNFKFLATSFSIDFSQDDSSYSWKQI